jgi:putative methionine-R-sulfoxide reductase with GAF domain
VIACAESWEDIELYGRSKRAWLEQFLALPNGIPSHDTFRRVFLLVDPEAFERSFLGWARAVFRPGGVTPRQIAIDGKTVRRSFDRKHGRSPLPLVSAYATEHGLVLAQRATESKGGELAVLPELLDGLDLRGCLVSLDALACRPGIAERIVGRGGDADEVLRAVVELLHDGFAHYSWVGIYFVEADDLVLGPWKGPQATDHVRIPVGQGICGAAAATGRTEIVDDVSADPRYLACFASTRAEIVVPIAYEGQVVGEIDIDSDEPAAFGEDDRVFLERVALSISPHCLVGWDTSGEAWVP